MKNDKLLLIIVIIIFSFINGCNKNQKDEKSETKESKKVSSETQTQKPSILEITENLPLHITYKGKYQFDGYFKGDKGKCIGPNPANIYWLKNNEYYVQAVGPKDTMWYHYETGTYRDQYTPQTYILNFRELISKAEKIGTDTILGYACDTYKGKDSLIICAYEGLVPLKMIGKQTGTYIAVKIEKAEILTEDFSEVPFGLEFHDTKYYDKRNVAPSRIGK